MEYPEAAVERDVFAYAQAGTLAEGLVELQEEASAASKKQKEDAKTELKEAQRKTDEKNNKKQ